MKRKVVLPLLPVVWLLLVIPAVGDGNGNVSGHSGARWLNGISTGVLAHDVGNLWSGAHTEDGIDLNAEVTFAQPAFAFLSGTIRPNLGVTVNDRGNTSKLYTGVIWEFDILFGMFINVGVGAALHNGELEAGVDDKKGLGSRVLFRIPIEVGFALNKHHRLSVAFAHASNAYLADPNEGLDTLGLRYGYRF
ncbi:MAG: acyloxyacyl hydrolase [Thermodesulfobacteriota bacterium]